MKKLPYPLNYFMNIWTPKSVFRGRKSLNLFQLLVTFILLNGILLIPISLNLQQSQGVNVVKLMPHTFAIVNEELVSRIQENQLKNGQLTTTKSQIYLADAQHLVGRNLATSNARKNQLIFNQRNFILKDENGYAFTVNYTKNFQMREATSPEKLKKMLQEQWLIQNRPFVVFTLILMIGVVIFISNLMVAFVSAGLLWFARKSQFSSIGTFKEALNLIVNAFGMGTLLGFMTGWFTQDSTIILTLQSAGMVLMLIATFLVTRFREDAQLKRVVQVGGIKDDKKAV